MFPSPQDDVFGYLLVIGTSLNLGMAFFVILFDLITTIFPEKSKQVGLESMHVFFFRNFLNFDVPEGLSKDKNEEESQEEQNQERPTNNEKGEIGDSKHIANYNTAESLGRTACRCALATVYCRLIVNIASYSRCVTSRPCFMPFSPY